MKVAHVCILKWKNMECSVATVQSIHQTEGSGHITAKSYQLRIHITPKGGPVGHARGWCFLPLSDKMEHTFHAPKSAPFLRE